MFQSKSWHPKWQHWEKAYTHIYADVELHCEENKDIFCTLETFNNCLANFVNSFQNNNKGIHVIPP